jgi:adenylosuccinate lyase
LGRNYKPMDLSALTAVSPVDGRYRNKIAELDDFFSEFALIRYRVLVEVEYFIALCELPLPQLSGVNPGVFEQLRALFEEFELDDALEVKAIEKETNHDVKAVEYFLKQHFEKLGLAEYKEFVHFGLTSQDVNNTAMPMALREANHLVMAPALDELLEEIKLLAIKWKDVPMLARTHGQPASPTKLGKELYVFATRIEKQLAGCRAFGFSGKFGGATGNFNAHHIAYSDINWEAFADNFLNKALFIERQKFTTQIEHYDDMAAYFDNLRRINTILIDFCRDMWQYVAMDYFKQRIKPGEIGSSAMPHKVNPIDFENAEGNLGIANALFEHMGAKLPISRLQRDLTDSTVSRNIGVPFAHTLLAIKSIRTGLAKLLLNPEKLHDDLEQNWAVVAEAIQTILRREKYEGAYESLKALTRTNEKMTAGSIAAFIAGLDLDEKVKQELLAVNPHNYTGIDLLKNTTE